jgi:monoamine oxidase
VPFEGYPGMPPWAVEHRLAASAPADLPMGEWLAGLGLAAADRRAAAEWFGQQWAGEAGELSAGGVAAARRHDRSGPGVYTVDGGYRALADRLATGLDVDLSRPVRRLRASAAGVDADGAAAAVAVVAVPPGVVAAGALVVEDLPAPKLAAAGQLRAGDGIAVLATVDRPAPESAEVFDATGTGGFTSCVKGDPVTLTVAKGRGAAAVRALAADPAALAGALGALLPWAAGARVEHVQVADWGADPWARGAFPFPRVGAAGAGAVWAEPVGRSVFFAGDATEVGAGPMSVHAALGSGIKAAGRALEALR